VQRPAVDQGANFVVSFCGAGSDMGAKASFNQRAYFASFVVAVAVTWCKTRSFRAQSLPVNMLKHDAHVR